MDSIRQNGHVQQQQPFPYGTATPAPTDNTNFNTVQFSDPWKGGANPNPAAYAGMNNAASMAAAQGDLGGLKQPLRQNSVSSSFDQLSLNLPTTRSLPSQNIYQTDFMPATAGFPTTYAEQASTAAPTARATSNYAMNGYGSYDQTVKNNLYSLPPSLNEDRRLSHPSLLSSAGIMDSPLEPLRQRQSSLVDYTRPGVTAGSYHTADTLDASRGMLALGQGATRFNLPHVGGHRTSSSAASTNSYYPQSTSSSISSASSYPYYSGSMDSAGTDITAISEMYDGRHSLPTLPRPGHLLGGHHHLYGHQSGQAAMMGQFNSRVQSNTTKKHKCKICDKRFTRPSSLQTHMYSHTGEKPFACEVEGCGRQFSVVSNLRRHRKVHKPNSSDTETISNAGSV
ncbi:hypothetical protein AOL_s00007g157 [Orbilia oligospora ATCC 24927]|uniref:C2H2-type domain-containing protein n=1 Tax=Arthrobotrys oligospora (strain ATCC 24927 / CBS 115.81 / DSM 1491) TaxID=756982 RepID=G1X1J8_ARTOA|nr:hypothetical protein AOL_s00007g157 [Orbilia oligospora ATCC 24927]EGX52821.1 hypothetical protein AOL_s00007g157 [Orbilia oligospora ATCC 24927]